MSEGPRSLWRGFQRVPGVPGVQFNKRFFYWGGGGGVRIDLNNNQAFLLFLLGPRGFQVQRVPGIL